MFSLKTKTTYNKMQIAVAILIGITVFLAIFLTAYFLRRCCFDKCKDIEIDNQWSFDTYDWIILSISFILGIIVVGLLIPLACKSQPMDAQSSIMNSSSDMMLQLQSNSPVLTADTLEGFPSQSLRGPNILQSGDMMSSLSTRTPMQMSPLSSATIPLSTYNQSPIVSTSNPTSNPTPTSYQTPIVLTPTSYQTPNVTTNVPTPTSYQTPNVTPNVTTPTSYQTPNVPTPTAPVMSSSSSPGSPFNVPVQSNIVNQLTKEVR